MSDDSSKELYKQFMNLLLNNPDYKDQFLKNMMDTHFDDESYWKHILETTPLTDDFIKNNIEHIAVKYLLKYQKLSDDMLMWLKENVVFSPDVLKHLVEYQHMSKDMLVYYLENMYPVDWNALVPYQDLPPDIIDKYHDKWDWRDITIEQFLTLELIEKYADKIYWPLLAINQRTQYLFNDSFVYYFRDKPIWDNIGMMENVTIECIMGFKDRVTLPGWNSVVMNKVIPMDVLEEILRIVEDITEKDMGLLWSNISTYQELTQEFMDKYETKLDWREVCITQVFDWEFIKRHSDKILLQYLSRNENLTKELVEKIRENGDIFKDELDIEFIKEIEN